MKAVFTDGAKPEANRFAGPLHASGLLVHEKGLKALCAGYATLTLKQKETTSARMNSYNILSGYERTEGIEKTTTTDFVNSTTAGVFTTFATKYFNVVKTRAQNVKYAGIIEATMKVWNDEDIKGLWRSTTKPYFRTVVTGVILFTFK